MLVTNHDLQLLPPNTVRLGPECVVLSHYLGSQFRRMWLFPLYTNLTILNNSSELVHHSLMDIGLLADHCVVLVITVVGIP